MNDDFLIDKRLARRSFERAAETYDKAAVLQREVCDRMLSRLEVIKAPPLSILDAGSGTGYGSGKLRECYPGAGIVALDIAFGMLKKARTAPPWWKRVTGGGASSQCLYVCGDLEQLPFRSSSVGMVWSNLTLQWCNDLNQAFAEAHRVLVTDGLFMFSTFGPDTLKELRQAFGAADAYRHVNRFIDMHDIGDALVHNGFANPVMEMEYITLTYDDVTSAMRDLKAIGAHNVTRGRRHGLTGKSAWQRAVANYEAMRKDGRLPATFEVVYGHAWKPEPRMTQDGKQIVKMDLKRSG